MSQSNSGDCYTYVACIDEEGNVSAWVELGCISSGSTSQSLQTSNLPICRKNKTIRKKIDGIENSASFQLENADDTDNALFAWFLCAVQRCKELAIAYLDKPIDDPTAYGLVLYGAASANWTRNVGEKNLSISQEATQGAWCWTDYTSLPCSNSSGNVGDVDSLPTLSGDVPAIPGCEALQAKKKAAADAARNAKSGETQSAA